MKIVNLPQGSPEWIAHRAQHFNASDAPAMMGVSPYKTRSELVREYATGIKPEVDAAQQRRFDMGHRAEALARPLAEEIIGQELSPLVGVADEGRYSASYDGLTMLEETAFEHKALNDTLRAVMVDGCTGADLPELYRIQMEHQCMVCPPIERTLFMASKWADDGALIEERHCWYTPNPELRARIVAGWAQFEADVAAYVPEPAAPPAPVAQAIEALPALVIRVEGRVVSSNLDAYRRIAEARIAAVKTELQTDQDFADAEETAKHFKEGAAQLKLAKQQAQAEAESIDQVFRAIDHIVALMDNKRIELVNLVTAEKERRRGEIVAVGVTGLREHIEGLNARLGKAYMPNIPADFGGAIKGKRNLDSMRDAVASELARAKTEANQMAERVEKNLKALAAAAEHATLFPDVQALVLKAPDDLAAVIASRISTHKAAEAAKAAPAPAPAPAALATVGTLQPVATGTPAANEPQHRGPPTLRIGAIAERLGFNLTAEQLRGLGIEPAGRDRGATLYHEGQFSAICDALARRAAEAKAAHAQRLAA